jgi:hypothetical protein
MLGKSQIVFTTCDKGNLIKGLARFQSTIQISKTKKSKNLYKKNNKIRAIEALSLTPLKRGGGALVPNQSVVKSDLVNKS